jgi:tetratricopeptide (TPR) repeat protein
MNIRLTGWFLWMGIALLLAESCDHGNSRVVQSVNGKDSILDLLNAEILNHPEEFVHYVNRARYLGQKEQYSDAMRDIERALELDSNQAITYFERGEIYWKKQEVKLAYESYKKSILKDPQFTDGIIKKASIDIVLNNFSEALNLLDQALKIQVTNPIPYYFKGRLFKAKGDTTLAISSYQTAVELDPKYYDAYVELALLVAAQKNDLAEEYYKTAIGIRPRSIEVWYNRAMFLQENGNRHPEYYVQALSCYDTIAHIDTNFFGAYYNKGFIYFTYLKEYTKAVTCYTQAIKSFPSYYQAFYSRGLCYEVMNDKKSALEDYNKALVIKPDYDDAALAKGRLLDGK